MNAIQNWFLVSAQCSSFVQQQTINKFNGIYKDSFMSPKEENRNKMKEFLIGKGNVN